ncbi:MAG: PA14 domain-containing protein [Caldilineaceae bacterium]
MRSKLSTADDQLFSYYFTPNNGVAIAVVGETAAIEQQVDELAQQSPAPEVRIWGVRQPASDSEPAMIIISEILAEGMTPITTATPSATAAVATATVRVNGVNLYSGPGQNYAVVEQLSMNEQCQVTGRSQVGDWLHLRCMNVVDGWVAMQLVTVSNLTLNLPIVLGPVAPTPTFTLTPTPTIRNWKTSYFNNTTLTGTPVLVADVESINMNWGSGAPAAGVNADNFSIRFERTLDFAPNTYRFTVRADDGIRVWVDERLILDQWNVSAGDVEYVVDLYLAGSHALRIEYYEVGGLAFVMFTYGVAPPIVATATPSTIQAPDLGGSSWSADYFDNPDLSGIPVMRRREGTGAAAPLDLFWSSGTPGYGVPTTNWSARWLGDFSFESGNYVFAARVNDGVRIFIDDIRVLEEWNDGYWEGYNKFFDLGVGYHTMRVEYYNRTGEGRLQVWWYKDVGPQLAP